MTKIMLDPGHDGVIDVGAIGPNATKEATITMQFCKKLGAALTTAGHAVAFTRTGADAKANSLTYRAELANNWPADLFISIHCNSFTSPEAHGFEIWTCFGKTKADQLAELIYQNMLKMVPELSGRSDKTDDDSDKESNFTVLVETNMPAVLVELAFISNSQEESLLKDPHYQKRAVNAIVTAVSQYIQG